jgi:hypothetical protein
MQLNIHHLWKETRIVKLLSLSGDCFIALKTYLFGNVGVKEEFIAKALELVLYCMLYEHADYKITF